VCQRTGAIVIQVMQGLCQQVGGAEIVSVTDESHTQPSSIWVSRTVNRETRLAMSERAASALDERQVVPAFLLCAWDYYRESRTLECNLAPHNRGRTLPSAPTPPFISRTRDSHW
jgi:hypothetical protein